MDLTLGMSCWTRQNKFFFNPEDDPAWLTSQLKFAREQLERKARFCDKLAMELKTAQADLDARGLVIREVRQMLGSTNAELRAAAHAGAVERDEHAEEAAALRERSERLRAEAAASEDLVERSAQEAAQLRRQLACAERHCEAAALPRATAAAADLGAGAGRDCGQPPAEPRVAAAALREAELEDAAARERAASRALQEELQACQDQCVWLQEQRSAAAAAAAAAATADAATELERLRAECARERELGEEAARQLQALRAQRAEEVRELNSDMATMSSGLEQKEEDILSIQFQMVELQNRLQDQAQLIYENADAFQQASEELADKDDKLERMKVLLTGMKDVSLELQSKVTELSQELESSRAAYQVLDEQYRAVVNRLEGDRGTLEAELARVREEASVELAGLREELSSREAAAEERRAALEQELEASREEARRTAGALEGRLRLEQAPAARAASEVATSMPEAAKVDAERARVLQEQLMASTEGLAVAEAQVRELRTALERSRLVERQAREQVQEYRSSLELSRDFGKDCFLAAAPRGAREGIDDGTGLQLSEASPTGAGGSARWPGGPEVPGVLIAAELDLGRRAGAAVLSVAPWQTRSDFQAVVEDFMRQHQVEPACAGVLVKYLEALEAEALTFPVNVKASLVELQRRYG